MTKALLVLLVAFALISGPSWARSYRSEAGADCDDSMSRKPNDWEIRSGIYYVRFGRAWLRVPEGALVREIPELRRPPALVWRDRRGIICFKP